LTSQSYGDSKILGGQKSQTPEPIDKKFGMGDNVGDDSHWGRGGICVKYHSRMVFSFPILSYTFFVTRNFACFPRQNRRTDFYAVCFIGREVQFIAFL